MIRNNNNQQNSRRRGRGGGQGGGMGGAPRPQGGQSYGNNRLDIRQRGNATQLLEKYKTLARDAAQQGDRVVSEYYLQYADHYFRVLNEIRERQPENQRGPRPGYDADEDDGVDVGNGYNPAYAAQSNGNGQDDDGEGRDEFNDEAPRRDAQPQQRDQRDGQRDGQRDAPREDRRRDEPRYTREQPRRDDQGDRMNDGRGDNRSNEMRGDARRDEPRRDDPRRDDARRDGQRADARQSAPRDEPRREPAPRAERMSQDAAPRESRRAETRSAPLVEQDDDRDTLLLAGIPGPATLSVSAPVAAPTAESPDTTVDEPPRRRRGRPRKVDVEAALALAAGTEG